MLGELVTDSSHVYEFKKAAILYFIDRDTFAQLVREVASPDVGRMGIEILSFTIKDIFDTVEYLNSLGKTQTAVVKKEADIGVAEANRDAGIKVSLMNNYFGKLI